MFGNFRRMRAPGLVRVDSREDRSGCDAERENDLARTPDTVRLSRATGLLYAITQDTSIERTEAWYVATVDFRTGRTVNRTLFGTGGDYAQLYNPPSIGPDGTLHQGVRTALVAVADTP